MWEGGTDETGLSAEPIRQLEDVRRIKTLLSRRPRDLLLLCLGANNALRAEDLLRVAANQVRKVGPQHAALVRYRA